MRKYWRYGKTPDALLPLYKECGGPGKKREITEKMIKEAEEKGKTIPKKRKTSNRFKRISRTDWN